MKNKISTIKNIYANHRKAGRQPFGSYMSRKSPYRNAKMTLWAITESGDQVWLDTREGLPGGSIERKIRKYEEENQEKIGRAIEYTPSGFIRSYIDERGAKNDRI